ncbi:MmcQ/YjbR family DNA-binding protein [Bacterioplanoides sp.]|uniref:MmcQ/YjbR family DNA-binding protein n=1 Tax=Bacterioplanoides sp. TaxID=2066072 RepID=UPI003AFFF32A
MDHLKIREYLLSKPEAWEDFPFYPDVAVIKVKNKMFATLSPVNSKEIEERGSGYRMNLKCDPEEAIQLRDVFDSVLAGYHMNKKHWNTIILNGEVPMGELERMIDNSYALVLKSMTKAERRSLETSYSQETLYGQ